VKRRDLLRHLQQHGCSIKELLVRKICRDLAVPPP
jgi:hypothetical protein